MPWEDKHTRKLVELRKKGLGFAEIKQKMASEYPDFPELAEMSVNALRLRHRKLKARQRKPKKKPRPIPGSTRQRKSSPSRGAAWTPEQLERAFKLLSGDCTYDEVIEDLENEFGVRRSVSAIKQRMLVLRNDIQTKKKAPKGKGALQRVRADVVLTSASAGVAKIAPGRAITVDFEAGSLRLLPSGELPMEALQGVIGALLRAVVE